MTDTAAVAIAERFVAQSGCRVGQPRSVVLVTPDVAEHYGFLKEYAGYWFVSFCDADERLGDPLAVMVNDASGEADWLRWRAQE